jgi:hypothetical protein
MLQYQKNAGIIVAKSGKKSNPKNAPSLILPMSPPIAAPQSSDDENEVTKKVNAPKTVGNESSYRTEKINLVRPIAIANKRTSANKYFSENCHLPSIPSSYPPAQTRGYRNHKTSRIVNRNMAGPSPMTEAKGILIGANLR